jgi:ring-1,2-phenylacetyl-CoA epoxidase subunit PaaD
VSAWQLAWKVLEAIPDPEIPVVSIRELGILREINERDGELEVVITPTYSGCPAMGQIEDDVKATLAANDLPAVLTHCRRPGAPTGSPGSREKLRAFGIRHRMPYREQRDAFRAPPRPAHSGAVPALRLGQPPRLRTSAPPLARRLQVPACLEPFDLQALLTGGTEADAWHCIPPHRRARRRRRGLGRHHLQGAAAWRMISLSVPAVPHLAGHAGATRCAATTRLQLPPARALPAIDVGIKPMEGRLFSCWAVGAAPGSVIDDAGRALPSASRRAPSRGLPPGSGITPILSSWPRRWPGPDSGFTLVYCNAATSCSTGVAGPEGPLSARLTLIHLLAPATRK